MDSPLLPLVGFIRLLSQRGRLATLEQLLPLSGLDLEVEDVPAAWQTLVADPSYRDLRLLSEGENHYLYSNASMVDAYAERYVAIQSGRLVQTVAEHIRHYSALGEVFPQSTLNHPPYQLDETAQAALRAQLHADDQTRDIDWGEGRDGPYGFSCHHLSRDYAAVLANQDPFEFCC
ncbi:hypothetical protein [Ferrimonas balearica]|uniref:hypothetical protein n=1 Tax=Ferrimonas balearica TaxID=44012 RepID=UPI001F1F3F49|nr:hypothetical protein [Ferrimonas balearica]MBY6018131.1 hypothetical protein [Halomonas denitrificans]MBY6094470.1 hypothetical protein [Ferrimonas balearica]